MRLSGFIFKAGLKAAPQSASLPTRPLGLALRAVVCSLAHSGGLKVALRALCLIEDAACLARSSAAKRIPSQG